MKCCIIAIAKKENKYIQEWVNYHLNLGFDNIIICDNNDTGDEKISDVINDDKVIILNYFNFKNIQPTAYTKCFLKYKDTYDWLAFIDIDEFIILDKKYDNNIKNFLSDNIFKNADIIRLCYKFFTGGNKLDVENNDYSLMSRFTEEFDTIENTWGKSIIKNTIKYIPNTRFYGHGYATNKNNVAYSADGNICKNDWIIVSEEPIYVNAWINHYPTKTIGEYVRQKYFRGGPNNNNNKYKSLNYFFRYNKKTDKLFKYGIKLINSYKQEIEKKKIKTKINTLVISNNLLISKEID